MAKGPVPPPTGGKPASEARKAALRADSPFDLWLHKQLHEMYDSIAKEPLPEDLLKLIDKDAGSAPEQSSDDGNSSDGNSSDGKSRKNP